MKAYCSINMGPEIRPFRDTVSDLGGHFEHFSYKPLVGGTMSNPVEFTFN